MVAQAAVAGPTYAAPVDESVHVVAHSAPAPVPPASPYEGGGLRAGRRGPDLSVAPPYAPVRRLAKQPKSPDEVYGAKMAKAKGQGTNAAQSDRDKARAKLIRSACSWTVAYDIWHGRDYSRATRQYVGAGTLKRPCANPRCARLTPPQDIGDLSDSDRYYGGRWCEGFVRHGLCTDCRIAATTRPDAQERPPRTKLDQGSDDRVVIDTSVRAEMTLRDAAATAAETATVEGESDLPVGGMAEPALPQFDSDMTGDRRLLVMKQYQREVSAYRKDEAALSSKLEKATANYNRLMAEFPDRQPEWDRMFRREMR